MGIPNRGSAGDALDATVTGLVRVEGPAVWFPGTAGNSLSSAGFTIPSTAGTLALPFTNGALTITASDIANAAPDAASFVCSTGQTITVNRSASGPVTTIVPEGVVEYINPDDTASGAGVATADDPAFDVAADEDAVLVQCVRWGRNEANFHPSGINISGSGGRITASLRNTPSSAVVNGNFVDAAGNTLSGTALQRIFTTDRTVVSALVLDRATGTLRHSAYGPDGALILTGTADVSTWGAMTPSQGMRLLANIPGSFSGALWNKGVGIAPTDEELAVIARRLLVNANRPAKPSTGALPPAWAPVYGDRWRALNGHVARFDGAAWQPETPVENNVAALLANNTFLIGAEG